MTAKQPRPERERLVFTGVALSRYKVPLENIRGLGTESEFYLGKEEEMILFNFSNYDSMAETLLTLPFLNPGQFTVARYSNQELHVRILTPVSNEHCFILGSIAPPDEQLISVMLLAHTLRREGASRVTAILPYLAYSRQDTDETGESMAIAWISSALTVSCVNEVITVDVHSERDKELFSIPLSSLPTAEIFAEAMRKWQLTETTVVAPDHGAIRRCEAVAAAAGMSKGKIPFFEKRRSETGIEHIGPIGEVGPRVVIIDDMLDTGGTLVSACEKLVLHQVQEIYIMVTHGLFTGDVWKRLWSLRVKHIFCTDTLSIRPEVGMENITILSVLPLLQRELTFFEWEKKKAMATYLD